MKVLLFVGPHKDRVVELFHQRGIGVAKDPLTQSAVENMHISGYKRYRLKQIIATAQDQAATDVLVLGIDEDNIENLTDQAQEFNVIECSVISTIWDVHTLTDRTEAIEQARAQLIEQELPADDAACVAHIARRECIEIVPLATDVYKLSRLDNAAYFDYFVNKHLGEPHV